MGYTARSLNYCPEPEKWATPTDDRKPAAACGQLWGWLFDFEKIKRPQASGETG
jgi:hypothetical protein